MNVKSAFLWGTTFFTAGLLLKKWLTQKEPIPLVGKVVIITGSSSGIGRVAAHHFAQAGSHVVLVARREKNLREVQQELAKYPVETLVIPTDVSQDEDLINLVQKVMERFGRIDVLVNNAGLEHVDHIELLNPKRLRLMIEVNMYGPIRLTQLVVPIMRQQQYGHIVNVSSMSGEVPSPGMVSYAATRAGITNFTRGLRRELDGTGIEVTAVLPGWTHTEMTKSTNEALMRESGGLLPFEHFVDAAVPAQAILDSVRYQKPIMYLGGLQMRSANIYERITPTIIDLWMRHFMSVPKWIEAVSA